jgi:hypothetical protein
VVAVVSEQALEANGAEAVLAECLDFLGAVNLAAGLLELTNLVVTHLRLN